MFERMVQITEASAQPEVALLLACSRTHLTPELSARIRSLVQDKLNWMALVRLAMRHEVMTLLYRNLQDVCPDFVPADILGPLRARFQFQAQQAQRLAKELVRILPAFEKEGILAVPWKGPLLAQRLYGDLSLRESGDLDIMVLERDVRRAQAIVRQFGYEFSYLKDLGKLEDDLRTRRELLFHRSDGALLELQWRFATRTACVEQDPGRFLQRFETVPLAGAQVRSLPLEIYSLILPIHATKHKWGQIKLICDIAEILRCTDLDWRYVLAEAGDLGIKRMLEVGILLAKDLFEISIPEELSRGLKIDRTTRVLAAEVRCGLFKEPDKNWRGEADFPFQLKSRERLHDRASMLYWNLPSKLQPDERDRHFLPMRQFFFPLYYFVRPVRWTWGKIMN